MTIFLGLIWFFHQLCSFLHQCTIYILLDLHLSLFPPSFLLSFLPSFLSLFLFLSPSLPLSHSLSSSSGCKWYCVLNWGFQTSLVVQWLRIRLPMQRTRVWALVREDPTCRRATKPICHNYWAYALQPVSHNYWAHAPRETVLCNKRNHHSEKPTHHNEE